MSRLYLMARFSFLNRKYTKGSSESIKQCYCNSLYGGGKTLLDMPMFMHALMYKNKEKNNTNLITHTNPSNTYHRSFTSIRPYQPQQYNFLHLKEPNPTSKRKHQSMQQIVNHTLPQESQSTTSQLQQKIHQSSAFHHLRFFTYFCYYYIIYRSRHYTKHVQGGLRMWVVAHMKYGSPADVNCRISLILLPVSQPAEKQAG